MSIDTSKKVSKITYNGVNIPILGGGSGNYEDKEIYINGDYTASSEYDAIGLVKSRIKSKPYVSSYADKNGKFVKPDEWDDIESQSLDGTKSELWLLYDNTIEESWCCFKGTTNTGKYKVEIGRIVDGIFNILSTTEFSSGSVFSVDFSSSYPNEDYLVVHTYPSVSNGYFSAFAASAYTYNGVSHAVSLQPLLMRYGCLPQIKSLAIWGTQYIISDNIINLKSVTSLAGFYNSCYRLVRHRHTGWDTKSVTTASSMFQNCYLLSDIDNDFSGWFSNGVVTSLQLMFENCYSLCGDINVTGWNLEKVTTIGGIFGYCYNICKIVGIENWYLPLCYTLNSSNIGAFQNCCSLFQNENNMIDLSNWRLAEKSTSTTSISCISLFNSCQMIEKINISNWNLERCSSLATMFNSCLMLNEIIFPDSIGSVTAPTTINSMFSYCTRLKYIKIPNINLNSCTNIASMFQNCYMLEEVDGSNIKKSPIGSSSNTTTSNLFSGCYSLRKVDISWIDCDRFTYSTSQLTNIFQYAYLIEELYPQTNINKNYTVNASPHLSRESILRILNNLKNVTTKTTLSLGSINLAKITDADKGIATQKGWTLA